MKYLIPAILLIGSLTYLSIEIQNMFMNELTSLIIG